MDKINIEKREKLKKYILGLFFIMSLGFLSKFQHIENKIIQKEEKYEVKYDSEGFISEINNNGKLFKFKKGELL